MSGFSLNVPDCAFLACLLLAFVLMMVAVHFYLRALGPKDDDGKYRLYRRAPFFLQASAVASGAAFLVAMLAPMENRAVGAAMAVACTLLLQAAANAGRNMSNGMHVARAREEARLLKNRLGLPRQERDD